jgi:hypothetical protein
LPSRSMADRIPPMATEAEFFQESCEPVGR